MGPPTVYKGAQKGQGLPRGHKARLWLGWRRARSPGQETATPVPEGATHKGSLGPSTAPTAFETQRGRCRPVREASCGRSGCPAGATQPWNPPQRTHTCGLQEPLVHAVTEEAEQAVGPGHTSLQLLVGDWLVRVPVLHLAAGDRRKAAQKQGSPLRPPGSQRPPPRAVAPFQSRKHCLLLAVASGCLGLAEESQGQVCGLRIQRGAKGKGLS